MERIYLAYIRMISIHLLIMLEQFFFSQGYTGFHIVPINYLKIVQTSMGMTIFTTIFVTI